MAGTGRNIGVTRRLAVWLAIPFALLGAGCGGEEPAVIEPTIRLTTEALIEEQITGPAGLGPLTPACPEVDASTAGVGTTFQCTATTEDNRVVTLQATIDNQGLVQVATTNVITGPALPSFERAAVDALNASVQSTLDHSAIDCGDDTVVLPTDQNGNAVLVCGLFDPLVEATFDVTLSITNIEGRQFSLVVADQARP